MCATHGGRDIVVVCGWIRARKIRISFQDKRVMEALILLFHPIFHISHDGDAHGIGDGQDGLSIHRDDIVLRERKNGVEKGLELIQACLVE